MKYLSLYSIFAFMSTNRRRLKLTLASPLKKVESKMRALEKDEGRLAPGRRRKHHRLDRFLLQFYIRQFGTKSLARKKLRQFVTSVR